MSTIGGFDTIFSIRGLRSLGRQNRGGHGENESRGQGQVREKGSSVTIWGERGLVMWIWRALGPLLKIQKRKTYGTTATEREGRRRREFVLVLSYELFIPYPQRNEGSESV